MHGGIGSALVYVKFLFDHEHEKYMLLTSIGRACKEILLQRNRKIAKTKGKFRKRITPVAQKGFLAFD